MKTGDLLRDSRKKKELTLREVAELSGIETSNLGKIEMGTRKATKEQAIKLAEILGIDKKLILTLRLSDKILHQIEGEDYVTDALKTTLKFFQNKKTRSGKKGN